jgi:AcrR family transcriptional regulator
MSGTGDVATPVTTGRREELLAAAREVLSTNGYERTTVSSIATRANVAQGTFYLYFPSKEALPGAIARQLSEAFASAAESAVEGIDDLEEAVDALVKATWDVAAEQRDVIPIANRGVELAETFEDFLAFTAPFRAVIEDLVRRLQAAGAVDPTLDPVTTAYLVRDLLDRSVKAKVCFGQDRWAEETAQLVSRALAV